MTEPRPTRLQRLVKKLENHPKAAYILFFLLILSNCGGLFTAIEKGYDLYAWFHKPPQGIVATVEVTNPRKTDVQINPTASCDITESTGNESTDWEVNLGLHLFPSGTNDYLIKSGKTRAYEVHFGDTERNRNLMERGNSTVTLTVTPQMEQGYRGSIPFEEKTLRNTKVAITLK